MAPKSKLEWQKELEEWENWFEQTSPGSAIEKAVMERIEWCKKKIRELERDI